MENAPIASNMTADPNTSKLVQPPLAQAKKKVKIKAVTAIYLNDKTLAPGTIAEVDEETAEEFCRKFEGNYSFAGERSAQTSERHVVVRAERVS